MKGSRKNENERFFGKDLGNEINNINKNISSILDKLKNAKNSLFANIIENIKNLLGFRKPLPVRI